MRRWPGNKVKLGIVDGKGVPLEMTPEMRSTHLYICGSTGTGKSKMLEYLMTLLESEHLIDRTNKRMRTEMTGGLSKRSVSQDWAYANALSPRDFDAQISSTVNRFHS